MKPRFWLVILISLGASACDGIFGPDPVPTDLVILNGDGQVDTVGAVLAAPLVVKLLDENGDAMSGVGVSWSVPHGDATVRADASKTGDSGTASATVTLGTTAEASAVEARVNDAVSVRFDVTALPDRPAAVQPARDTVRLDALEDTTHVEASVFDRYGNEIPEAPLTWSASDTTVVAVEPDGTVRSLAPGSALLTARSDTAAGAVTVLVIQRPDSLSVTPAAARLTAIEATTRLEAEAYDRNGFAIDEVPVDWSSGDTTVVLAQADGLVTAMGPGAAAVTAAVGEVTATATVTVEQEVAQVTMSVPGDTLREPGDTVRLTATARDRNSYEIPDVTFSWSSNRTSIATVDGAGLVTASDGRGEARITVTADGHSATGTVTRIPWGVLVLTFDDIHRDVYTRVLPVLQEHGIVANIAIPTDWVGQTIAGSPRLTESQISELHDAGWAVVPHSLDHSDLTYLSDAELDRQLRLSQKWVQDRGYRGSSVFVVPFHRWYETEREAIKKYYAATRGFGINHERYGGMVDWPAPDPYFLTSIPAGQYFATESGRQQMEAWWAEAVSKGRFLGTYFHSIAEGDLAAFEKVIERLVAFRDRLHTYADLFE